MSKKWWKRKRVIVAIGLPGLVLLGVVLLFAHGGPAYYHLKYGMVGQPQPNATPSPIVPETQTEPHTCGLHALSSLHRSYGLDPNRLGLRFRLGTDKPFINTDPDTTGTIHPDLFRVLAQDGFHVDPIDPHNPNDRQRLIEHLDAGHYAVALTKVNTYHWVVIAGRAGDELVVCDSLQTELYRRACDQYLDAHTYTLVLVRPAAEGERLSITEAHTLGAAEMLRVQQRDGG